jgi:hypothetical protein
MFVFGVLCRVIDCLVGCLWGEAHRPNCFEIVINQQKSPRPVRRDVAEAE